MVVWNLNPGTWLFVTVRAVEANLLRQLEASGAAARVAEEHWFGHVAVARIDTE